MCLQPRLSPRFWEGRKPLEVRYGCPSRLQHSAGGSWGQEEGRGMRRPSPSASAHQDLGLNFLPLPPLLSECFPGLHWGQRRSPPAPDPILLREPVRIICCFGSTALGGNRRQLWGGRRGKLCLPEGSSVLWDPAGAAPFNRCLTCCGMPGEGGIACACPRGRRELCGGCLQKAWGRARLLLRRKLGQ